jgi:hypothetical protein
MVSMASPTGEAALWKGITMLRKQVMRNVARAAVAASTVAGALALAPAAAAKGSGQDWLWLSGQLDWTSCVFTVTIDWSGFKQAKWVDVFVTEGATGSRLATVSATVRIQNKDNGRMVVTLPPLAPSAAYNYPFYPWAQLLDEKQMPIPASLDFSGGQGGYCQAP